MAYIQTLTCILMTVIKNLKDLNQDEKILDKSIRLCSLEDNSFNDIKEITEDILNSIDEDIKVVNEYNKHFLNFIYFQQNLLEFDRFCKTLNNIPVTYIDINKFITTQEFIYANRIVFNLLTSFKFFIDSSGIHIKRRFGNESEYVKKFENRTNKFFDDYFIYRFLVKLRNYTVHFGFPINLIPFNAIADYVNPERMIGSLSLVVDREEFLKEKSFFGAKVTRDLTEMTEDINVIPLINELGKLIFKLEKYIYSLHQVELEESISNLKMFAQRFKTVNNEVSIIHSITQIGMKISAKTLTIPFDNIEEIENFKIKNGC